MEVNSLLVGLWDSFEHADYYLFITCYYLLFLFLLLSEDLLYQSTGATAIVVLYFLSVTPACYDSLRENVYF